ncbi:hypothetical protein [Desertivirga arenae]|uniref:hypothetical protein n=1 Tax=Desertivirga arenae TaxID=2810309 RepID=UPI001A9759F1|nr:hypothetical protein [Pedobacter sp. SYSU D00823]
MIDKDDYLEDEGFGEDQPEQSTSLDEQEQLNSMDLVTRIEDENRPDFDDQDEVLNTVPGNDEGVSNFLEKTIPDNNTDPLNDAEAPVTKNLLGDNPPGSEQIAFDAGTNGDMGKDQVQYNSENIKENFRENLDKTSSEIDLDKRLKDQQ